MDLNFDFKNLFILDIANNHQGSVKHGKKIIEKHSEVIKKHGVNGALKFQFRNLDTFIHKNFKGRKNFKHISRFESTFLTDHDYQILFEEVKKNRMKTICTPFDEPSVDKIVQMGFDIIKVASCSSNDWPLMEKISKANLPTIISTGGLKIEEIDKIVSFSEHRKLDFALMHCVAIYPTSEKDCELLNIRMLKDRFPNVKVGWSTHEDPSNCNVIKIANSLGAEIFERHVGLESKGIELNKYSSTPKQINSWIQSWKQSNCILGRYNRVKKKKENESLIELKRGVYLNKDLKSNDKIFFDDVYFAMPCQNNQISAGEFRNGSTLKNDLKQDQVLKKINIKSTGSTSIDAIYEYVHKVKAMLNYAKINLGNEFNVEYSHHYGISKFDKVGCILIECINREYCKKILIQLPGQGHPFHYHKRKEETFQVLWGNMELNIDGRIKTLLPGDTALVLPGTWHKFRTETGFIAEEISTTHYNDDSIYKDKSINEKKRDQRKTVVKHWGRFELKDKLTFQ